MASTGRMPSAERRVQLINAARVAFVERGFRGVTTQDVAEAAGVSDALVLKHFGTKEALFRAAVVDPLLALIEDQVARNRERLRAGEHYWSPAEAEVGIAEFLRTWAALVADEREALRSLFADLRHFPDIEARLFGLIRTQIDDLTATLEGRSDEYRAFNGSVATWVSLAAATLAGVLVDEDTDAFVRAYVDLLMNGVLAR